MAWVRIEQQPSLRAITSLGHQNLLPFCLWLVVLEEMVVSGDADRSVDGVLGPQCATETGSLDTAGLLVIDDVLLVDLGDWLTSTSIECDINGFWSPCCPGEDILHLIVAFDLFIFMFLVIITILVSTVIPIMHMDFNIFIAKNMGNSIDK